MKSELADEVNLCVFAPDAVLTHTVFPGGRGEGRLNERPGGHNFQISVPRNSFETHFLECKRSLCPLLTRRTFATRHSFESRSSIREIWYTALIIPGELIK